MFAIIETGGKQYRVEEGFEFSVGLLNVAPGSELSIDKVLLLDQYGDTKIGTPYLSAMVVCEVLNHARGEKIIVFHKKKRNDYHKKQGHRQDFTRLKVKSIQI